MANFTHLLDLSDCPEYLEGKVSNGLCNDESNIPECAFDGGDCCGDDVFTIFCDICRCIEDYLFVCNAFAMICNARLESNGTHRKGLARAAEVW